MIDSDANPDHFTLGLELRLAGGTTILRVGGCVNRHFINGNSFAISATLSEVCVLPCAFLVIVAMHGRCIMYALDLVLERDLRASSS